VNAIDVQTWPVSRIAVKDRVRQDLGSLDDLKTSMTERGLINPITVKADGTLIAGERRLHAAQELEWTHVAVRIWRQQADATELLKVEAEENLCRKALTEGEANLFYQRLKKLLPKPKIGRPRDDEKSGESPEFSRTDRETRSKAAKATGYSTNTLEKVEEVRRTAEDETQAEEVRTEAKEQHERLMRGETKVAPALEKVKRKQRRQAKLATGLLPGQRIERSETLEKPSPTLSERLVNGIGKGQGLEELAAEIQDADLDLDSKTIAVLRKRLSEEIAARRSLNAALKGVLDRRKGTA
jgi:ParB family chromosome partitioning protein